MAHSVIWKRLATHGVLINKIVKVGSLSVISQCELLKAYCLMKLNIYSGLAAPGHMKNAPRKQLRLLQNFYIWRELILPFLESVRLVPEIQRVVLEMNFYIKSWQKKILKLSMKSLLAGQRVRRKLWLPALIALQQSVAIMHKAVLNSRCCTTPNCLTL